MSVMKLLAVGVVSCLLGSLAVADKTSRQRATPTASSFIAFMSFSRDVFTDQGLKTSDLD